MAPDIEQQLIPQKRLAGPRVFDCYLGQVHVYAAYKKWEKQIVVFNSNSGNAKKWFPQGAYFIFWVLVH